MAPGAPVAGSIENKLESRARMGARHARDATRTCFWSSVPKRKRCRSRTDCSRASEPNPTTLRKSSREHREQVGEPGSNGRAACKGCDQNLLLVLRTKAQEVQVAH